MYGISGAVAFPLECCVCVVSCFFASVSFSMRGFVVDSRRQRWLHAIIALIQVLHVDMNVIRCPSTGGSGTCAFCSDFEDVPTLMDITAIDSRIFASVNNTATKVAFYAPCGIPPGPETLRVRNHPEVLLQCSAPACVPPCLCVLKFFAALCPFQHGPRQL